MTTTPTSKRLTAVARRVATGRPTRPSPATASPAPPRLAWFVDGLAAALAAAGYEPRDTAGPDVQVVLHTVDVDRPRRTAGGTRRRSSSRSPRCPGRPDDLLRVGYPVLVRPSRTSWCSSATRPAAHFVTLEQGTTTIEHHGDDDTFFRTVFERVAPLASSRLVIANEFRPDLEPTLAAATSRPLRSVGPARG